MKELVTNVNIDAAPAGITMQAMDASHVALCSLLLKEDGFEEYRSDRPITMGLSIANLSKILKCASNEDVITIRAEEDPS